MLFSKLFKFGQHLARRFLGMNGYWYCYVLTNKCSWLLSAIIVWILDTFFTVIQNMRWLLQNILRRVVCNVLMNISTSNIFLIMFLPAMLYQKYQTATGRCEHYGLTHSCLLQPKPPIIFWISLQQKQWLENIWRGVVH